MASRGRGARTKGANFEREIANLLEEETSLGFKRGVGQTRGGGKEVADVQSDNVPGIHFELKRQKRCNIKAAYLQAKEDTKDNKNKPICVIITKDDYSEPLVTMNLKDWIEFLKSWIHTKNENVL